MIIIDGGSGEGGGQIVRSSLTMSAVTGEAVRITDVRRNRRKPGLMRQHLTALTAACEVSGGRAEGAKLGSTEFIFYPHSTKAGRYRFDIGTAGSASLVLQTVVPALLQAGGPSWVTVKGGTHNSGAPPYEFLNEAYLPALRQMGYRVTASIKSYGFYPAGGGEIEVEIQPGSEAVSYDMQDRGPETDRSLEVILSNLSGGIAERELKEAGRLLGIPPESQARTTRRSPGPGNVVLARLKFEHQTAVFAQFGQPGVSAEGVARRLAKAVKAFSRSDSAVTHNLADQLLLPMALARGGEFTTERPSLHARTNAAVITRFLGNSIEFQPTADNFRFCCAVTAVGQT